MSTSAFPVGSLPLGNAAPVPGPSHAPATRPILSLSVITKPIRSHVAVAAQPVRVDHAGRALLARRELACNRRAGEQAKACIRRRASKRRRE